MHSKIFFLVFTTLVYGCAPTVTRQTSTKKYEEDLSIHRPEIPESSEVIAAQIENPINSVPYVEPTHHLNTELDSVLQIMVQKNIEVGYLAGFSIQIYSGRSREEANRAKKTVDGLLDEFAEVYYDQPVFRVKVGHYLSKLEAEKSFRTLKPYFPQALVLPERIPIR